jgi:hypothetical protein
MALKNIYNQNIFAKIISFNLDYRSGYLWFDLGLYKNIDDNLPYQKLRYEITDPKKLATKADFLNVKNLQSVVYKEGSVLHLDSKFTHSVSADEPLLKFRNKFVKYENANWTEVFPNYEVYIENDGMYKPDYTTGIFNKIKEYNEWDFFTTFFSLEAQNSDGNNMIKNIYLYLKTLPEFSSAQDC